MDLLKVIFLTVFSYSTFISHAQAVLCQDLDSQCPHKAKYCDGYKHVREQCPLTCKLCVLCQDLDSQCPHKAKYCDGYKHVREQCPLTCKLCVNISPTPSYSLSPATQSTMATIPSSVSGRNDSYNGNWRNNTTTSVSASKTNFEHRKILLIIGILCVYFFSR